MNILLTGSSGFLGQKLLQKLKNFDVLEIDKNNGKKSLDLLDKIKMSLFFKNLNEKEFVVVHCAAARKDFGLKKEDYIDDNVRATVSLLSHLESIKVNKFIHLSSVAAIEGRSLENKIFLNSSDDIYRQTKYLQEKLIHNWSQKFNIPCYILAPSAIYDDFKRIDTNIDQLRRISPFLPFIPVINVKKSLTYLPNLVSFIKKSIEGKVPPGKFLCIENPVNNVSEIIQQNTSPGVPNIYFPFLKQTLYFLSFILWIISFGERFDTILTIGRLKKLYKSTSYENQEYYDDKEYNSFFKTL